MEFIIYYIKKKKYYRGLFGNSFWSVRSNAHRERVREHMIPSRCICSEKNKTAKRRIRRGSRSRRRRRRRRRLREWRPRGRDCVVPHDCGSHELSHREYTPLFRSDSLTPLNLSKRRLGRSCFFLRDTNAARPRRRRQSGR